jgi:DNA-binding transcriptional LysR family regulator
MTNSRPDGYACWSAGSEAQAHVVVSPSEAQRSAARRGQGIGALPSTAEAGEPNPWGPGGGKGAPG